MPGVDGRGVKRRRWAPLGAAGTRLMTLWLVFALMTAAAIFAVVLPLCPRARAPAEGSGTSVHKERLAELTRILASGASGVAELEAARIEIGRRLLAAADQPRLVAAQSNVKLRR